MPRYCFQGESPSLPVEGSDANYASIALSMVRPDCAGYAGIFLRVAASAAKGYDFLMLGLVDRHSLEAHARKLPHIKYRSRVLRLISAKPGSWTLGRSCRRLGCCNRI